MFVIFFMICSLVEEIMKGRMDISFFFNVSIRLIVSFSDLFVIINASSNLFRIFVTGLKRKNNVYLMIEYTNIVFVMNKEL